MAENRHPGITMHKVPVGGGFIGLLFAAGSALIFILGFPTLWYFVAFAALFGVGIAAVLRIVYQHRSDRDRPLSILAPETKPTPTAGNRDQMRLFRSALSFRSA